MFGCCWNYGRRGDSADCLLHVTGSQMGKVYLVGGIECQPFNVRVCKHCQFVFPSSVLSVMSVSGFPLIIMSAHAQCSMCTCSVEGIPSLVCPHMLSVGASLISMQCKHWRRRRIFGEDKEK